MTNPAVVTQACFGMIDPLDKVSESDLNVDKGGGCAFPGAAAGPAARAWLPAASLGATDAVAKVKTSLMGLHDHH